MATQRPAIVTTDGYRQQIPTGDTIDPTWLPSGSGAETATTIGALINGAGAATPNNTDLIATAVSGGVLQKITWTNAKTFLKSYFDGFYAAENVTTLGGVINGAEGLTTPADADLVAVAESGGVLRKTTWANIKAALLTYFNGKYPRPLFASTTKLEPAGTTLETMVTQEISANTLSVNKQALEIKFVISAAANANRTQHYVRFNGTQIAIFDQSHVDNLAGVMTVRITRISSSSILTSYQIDSGVLRVIAAGTSRIISLDLVNNNYDLTYDIQNLVTYNDSALEEYSAYLYPAP